MHRIVVEVVFKGRLIEAEPVAVGTLAFVCEEGVVIQEMINSAVAESLTPVTGNVRSLKRRKASLKPEAAAKPRRRA